MPAFNESELFRLVRLTAPPLALRFCAGRPDFSAEKAFKTDEAFEPTGLASALERGRFLTVLPKAAIFLGVCGSVALRLTGGGTTPV